MPIFHRNFVSQGSPDNPTTAINPEHLASVGPRLPVQVGITSKLATSYAEQGHEIPAPIDGYALFDTGASVTCVDESVLVQLDILPVGIMNVSTPSDPSKAVNTYTCALYFPGRPLQDIDPSFVAGVQLQNQGYIALIGRDILRNILMIYDGPGARITFAV